MSSTTYLTARTPHYCWDCQWNAPEGSTPAILPGHRYLRNVTFPGEPGHEEGVTPAVLNQCVTCACRIDDRAHLEIGACGSYCHGTNPCVLPFQKGAPGHDCVCCECAGDRAKAVAR